MTALRVDVLATSFSLLPKTTGRHQRAIVGATVACGGAQWKVMSVHLSTDPAERQRHLPAVVSVLSAEAVAPLIVGGDINEDSRGPIFDELSLRLQDAFAVAGTGAGFTSPAVRPVHRLDAIFASSSLSVVSCEAVDAAGVAAASDHRPVLAVLRQRR